ncbi:hypothetical protein [Bizionia myxarmorum]|uniref:Uncharacterized protein n=1 Tax=Bizionia myxarmorum TaxID=291186 RepID=A0A5D0RD34_9FLAO|nr:hypothetical protein [Bizionia myxarmorum]TYB78959.1 hypothetical protein ES674_04065 [Bizionia myxarmorum]
MPKSVSIAFSFLILFQSFNITFEDFSRFGVLLDHAEYHQEQYGDSFFEFIAEHYGDATFHPSSEHTEHEDLPFKEHHQTCAHGATVFTLAAQDYHISYQSFIEIPVNFYYQDSISLFEKQSVFQPPQHA